MQWLADRLRGILMPACAEAAERFIDERQLPVPARVVGRSEVAALLRISWVDREFLSRTDDAFPTVVVAGPEAGPVWRRTDIEGYALGKAGPF